MKRKLISLFIFSLCFSMAAQSPAENYIKVTTYTAPSTEGITENDTLVSVTYFDGLGRPKQKVSVRGGTSRLDHNLLSWKQEWTLGSASTPMFNKKGQTADNERIMGIDPFGKNAMLWRCGNDPDNDADVLPVEGEHEIRYQVPEHQETDPNGKHQQDHRPD